MEFIANIGVTGRYTHTFIRNSEPLDSQIAGFISSTDFGGIDFCEFQVEELHWLRASVKLAIEECGVTDKIEVDFPEKKICKADLTIDGRATVFCDVPDESLVDNYIKEVFLPHEIKNLKDSSYVLLSLYDVDDNCYFEGRWN